MTVGVFAGMAAGAAAGAVSAAWIMPATLTVMAVVRLAVAVVPLPGTRQTGDQASEHPAPVWLSVACRKPLLACRLLRKAVPGADSGP
jgi:hypothetical protein